MPSSDQPIQIPLPASTPTVRLFEWTLQPLATIELHAKVLATKTYSNDPASQIAPLDIAFGWGPMADDQLLNRIEITQQDRQYQWRWWGAEPLPENELIRHSTNAHLIPVDQAVAAQLQQLRPGQQVRVYGQLVEASHPDANQPWRSSLSRDDQGEGACEIILVESVQHISGRSDKL